MNYSEMVADALGYIERNLEREVSIRELAERYHVSPSHFYRIFRAVSNVTLNSYQLGRRLSEAARRLETSDQKIIDVAFEFGFGSHESFTRSFRRIFGMSPSEFRKSGAVLNLVDYSALVPRDFKNENRDVIVEYSQRDIGSIELLGQRIQFNPDEQPELGRATQFVTNFVANQITGKAPERLYSIILSDCGEPANVTYFCGVDRNKVVDASNLNSLTIPQSKYAVFKYSGVMGTIFETIINDLYRFLSVSDLEFNSIGIDLFELYGLDYVDTGCFQIYLPIK